MTLSSLLEALGPEIEDVEEETFSLFSQPIPSANLGFVSQHATEVELTINGRDLLIHQSPTILSSSRGGGTTGAVLWKVTPLFAAWISSPHSPLTKHGLLTPTASVLELGSGISGVVALCLAPQVGRYTLTDQGYVLKLLRQNLDENAEVVRAASGGRKGGSRAKRKGGEGKGMGKEKEGEGKIRALPLDWETDEVRNVVDPGESFDVVVACDCIYNDALIAPLVATCVDACKLRDNGRGEATVCVVGQQLRSDEVFGDWLREFGRCFRVWRVEGEVAGEGMGRGSGFVVHVGVLRDGGGE